MSSDTITKIMNDHQVSGDKCNYKDFLLQFNDIKNKRRVVDSALDSIYYKYSSSDVSVFDLFDKADRNQDGELDSNEFKNCLS